MGTDLPSDGKPAAVGTADAALSAFVVDGVWDCTVATPVGKEPHELTVRTAADGALTGEMKNVKSGDAMPLLDDKISGNQRARSGTT